MAVISLDFSAQACCPSTSRWRLAQAETRCSGFWPLPLLWARREVLPSIATISASASRKPDTQDMKQSENNSTDKALMTSLRVS